MLIVFGLLSVLSFAALFWGAQTKLTMDGLKPFDMRFAGYTFQEASVYLENLTPEARKYYLGTNRILDTVFPIAFSAFLGLLIQVASLGRAVVLRLLLLILPSGYLLLDLAENAQIAGLLSVSLSEVSYSDVSLASRFTVTKFGVLLANVVALAALFRMRKT